MPLCQTTTQPRPQRLEFGFRAAALAIVAIVIGANTALPILTIYQALWGFSTGILSIVYGIYTVGVIAAVFILGPVSDLVGRKRVLLPAFAVMAAGLVLGLVASNVWVLMASRLLQGLAVGAGVTTAVAALGELMYFTAHGRALPCCIAPFSARGYETYTLGDATQQSLREIWNSPAYKNFRTNLVSEAPPKPCQSCGLRWSL